jgi:hypothetical protein
MANKNLTKAKNAKNDEFYTQFDDIVKEMQAYIDRDANIFKDKIVYCNCDDPFESNFFQYFASKFKELGLKQLITTSYEGSPIAFTQTTLLDYEEEQVIVTPKGRNKGAYAYFINDSLDYDFNGTINIDDVKYLIEHDKNATKKLRPDGDKRAGDFRSADCVALLETADIVVTNPPFSLFREYLAQLVVFGKKFAIISNKNAITYKEVFPLIKENSLWSGKTAWSGGMWFVTMNNDDVDKVVDGINTKNVPSIWLTNIDHGKRHQHLALNTMAQNLKHIGHRLKPKNAYVKYDNYNAIEVPLTEAIPSDYDGVMGVPISFLDKYNPDQFEIVGSDYEIKMGKLPCLLNKSWQGKLDRPYINGNRIYSRIMIKHKKGDNK